MRTRRSASAVAGAALAATLIAGGSALAQDEPIVYSGCLGPEGQLTRMAVGDEPSAPCDENQQLVQWNQVGPQGPQGEQGVQGEPGPQGEQGPRGERGAAGTSATYRIDESFAGSGLVTGIVRCDEGDLVTGGGYRILDGPPVSVVETYASGARAWTVSMLVADGSIAPFEFEVRAVCSDLEPLREG